MIRLTIFALLAVVASEVPSLSGADQKATVSIHVVDPFGKTLGPVTVTRFVEENNPKGRNYSSSFKEGNAKGIPYGDYDVTVMGIGAKVEILAPETFIVLARPHYLEYMNIGPGYGPVLIGQVTGLPEGGKDPKWIRIIHLYNEGLNCCRTLRLGDDGSFATGLLYPGAYLVVVIDGRGVLFTGSLRLDEARSRVQIDVASGVIRVSPEPPPKQK